MKNHLYSLLTLLILCLSLACDQNPRVIEAVPENTHIISNAPSKEEASVNENPASKEHKVKVQEVLSASNYTYLKVEEGEEQYWIAISKSEVSVGDIIYYKGGLLQQNFKSKDLDREFETLYLVSSISDQPNASNPQMPNDDIHANLEKKKRDNVDVGNIKPAKGAIRLSELFSNKEKYKDQKVKVTGKCVKVNNDIMGRNWVHVRDGSGDGLDLTITTQEEITLGALVTLEGKIALEKDFGAGYKYDIIMEEAMLK